MHYRDETAVATPGLPRGLYWGVHLGDGGWKIDVWSEAPDGFAATRAFGERIAGRLTDENRGAILRIKSACWRHPEYRRGFGSTDIYTAVLEHGVADTDQFWAYLRGIGRGV